jgi:CRISPR/Cas system-associated exonuclease Cas4 (RecB family)
LYLSATFIKDYLACPQRAKYRLDGDKQKPNVYLARGIAVHETIEDQSIKDFETARQVFFLKFTQIVNETNPEFPYRVTFSNLLKQANTMLDYYYNHVNIFEPPVREIELQFKIEIKGIEFVGKIDQIRGNNVYDWKTKVKPIDTPTLSGDYQFTLYGMAYKELYGEYPENIYYGHLYSGNLYKIERTRKDYKYLEDVASKIILATEHEIFPRNYGDDTCYFCAYKHKCFNEKGEIIY